MNTAPLTAGSVRAVKGLIYRKPMLLCLADLSEGTGKSARSVGARGLPRFPRRKWTPMAVTDDIKARLDIVDVVADYVPDLKRAGRNYSARCPFHAENTPSFVVFPERQAWRCFGACAEGGDVFNFVQKIEGADFPTTLRALAERGRSGNRPWLWALWTAVALIAVIAASVI